MIIGSTLVPRWQAVAVPLGEGKFERDRVKNATPGATSRWTGFFFLRVYLSSLRRWGCYAREILPQTSLLHFYDRLVVDFHSDKVKIKEARKIQRTSFQLIITWL